VLGRPVVWFDRLTMRALTSSPVRWHANAMARAQGGVIEPAMPRREPLTAAGATAEAMRGADGRGAIERLDSEGRFRIGFGLRLRASTLRLARGRGGIFNKRCSRSSRDG